MFDIGTIDIIKLDDVVSHKTVPLEVPTMVSTNSDGLGEEVRPLPWPLFECKVGPMQLKESCTQSEGVLEDEVNTMHTKLDRTTLPASTTSTPSVHVRQELQVVNGMPFDPGRKLQQRYRVLVAIPPVMAEV